MYTKCNLYDRSRLAFFLAALLGCAAALHAQHVHLNAGATSTDQDAPLHFVNGNSYDTNAGYNVYLSFTNSGSFSNLYQGAGLSFTALASTLNNGGPAPGHAADGALLQLQFVSLSGPPDGLFGVWMQEPGNPSSSFPLFLLAAGMTNGTNLIALSESDGSPGADPYGHIHGRTFTASRPGLYTLGCRIVDTSSNGAGGGSIHAPSGLYYFHFQAGITISSWAKNPDSLSLTFGTTTGKNYYVESTPDLTTPNWTTLAGPFAGDNHLLTAVANSTAAQLFFRLRSDESGSD
jgi:hypothetical protein